MVNVKVELLCFVDKKLLIKNGSTTNKTINTNKNVHRTKLIVYIMSCFKCVTLKSLASRLHFNLCC